ncbi:MAG TPA: TonB-dependent receptor, partial [Chitinophaga sp.]
YPTLNTAGDTVSAAGVPVKTQNTLLSYFGRVTYSFYDKYLLTGTIRRDGSSRFLQHWGTFPSVAFAWRIGQEEFLKHSSVVSDLKLRLGYGITGQQDIGSDYSYLPAYTIGAGTAAYQFGNDFITTLRPEGYDANIKWEQTATYNAGIDYGFLNGRIAGSIDYYYKKTSDLLSQVPVASGSNLTNQIYTNVGNITTKGLEFTVNAGIIQTEQFTWNAGFNISYNNIRITNLSKVKGDNPIIQVGGISGGTGDMVQVHKVGYAPYAFFLYKQVYDKNGKPIEGAYVDQNQDSSITASDLVVNKSPNPTVTMGFNSTFTYAAWSLAFSLRANLGNYVYNNIASNFGTYANIAPGKFLNNATTDVLNTQFAQYQRISDYYLDNASFLRMDNLSLGYDFGKVGRKVDLRVTASAQNLFVVTKYSGLDPEIYSGIDDKFYQRPRTYSLGINLGF